MIQGKRLLLVVGGSIAAYKSLELLREWRRSGGAVSCILTKGGAEFITPLSLSALSGEPTYTELFSLKDETEMGHIRLAREADVILYAPVSADMLAKMAAGLADDLASTVYLAAGAEGVPVLVAPAMNPHMWNHPATQRNLKQVQRDGVRVIMPASGSMACGETGEGRLAELSDIIKALQEAVQPQQQPLQGVSVLLTGGATREPLDPVRFLSNHSSGKQAVAIAEALRDAGADVTLLHGFMDVEPPTGGITAMHTPTAKAMLNAALAQLPKDIAICAAAVADWQMAAQPLQKMKKQAGQESLSLTLTQTPDILASICGHQHRPTLVIGFAAETETLLENAKAKRERKSCDWILANDVANGAVFGKDSTDIHCITATGHQHWGAMSKGALAHKLVQEIIMYCHPERSEGSPFKEQEQGDPSAYASG